MLQRLLVDAGFQVRVAEDGAQGVEMFRTWQPQFIWMDLRLPIMGGLEAAREIRALEGGRQVKIVALTASAFARQREEVLAAGLDDFVRKPYRPGGDLRLYGPPPGRALFIQGGRRGRPLLIRPSHWSRKPWPRFQSNCATNLQTHWSAWMPGQFRKSSCRVSEQDARLGVALASCAKRFAYTRILNALENGHGRSREESHDS